MNEFDVAFVCRNQLFPIECKAVKQNTLKDISPFIDKLDSIKNHFVGLTVHVALILVGSPVSESLQNKADQRGILTIAGKDLEHLDAVLEDWVKEK